MSVIIDLNTDELESVVQIAKRANEMLSEAANLLNSVVIHNDWQCPERTEINNNTTHNRSQSLTLQADAESFYNNINYASQQFIEVENLIYRSFDKVDAPIAQFLSRTPVTTMVNKPPVVNNISVIDKAKSFLQGARTGFGADTVDKGIDIVSFGGIVDAFMGK